MIMNNNLKRIIKDQIGIVTSCFLIVLGVAILFPAIFGLMKLAAFLVEGFKV